MKICWLKKPTKKTFVSTNFVIENQAPPSFHKKRNNNVHFEINCQGIARAVN